MMEHVVTPEDFSRLVRSAYALAGISAPAKGEACVLVFNGERWLDEAATAQALLGAEERERAGRFRHERDRAIYCVAHACWRIALGLCLDMDAERVPLTSLPSGQPVLAGGMLSTSLSHSGSWVAIAMADARTVGVDIECSPPRRPLIELLDTICTAEEAARMRRLPETQREAALLALWVRKEALLKAFGTGLLEAPSSFEAWTDQAVAAPPASGLPACSVTELALASSLVGALAAPADVRIRQFVFAQEGLSCR